MEILSLVQVIHDSNQIRTPKELVVGGKYYFKSAIPPEIRDEFVIVSLPDQEGFFDVDSDKEGCTFYHLADKGIIPYDDVGYKVLKGRWNAVNYIVPF